MILSSGLGKKVLYILAELLNKLIPFAALPFYAKYLSAEEFGIVSNFTVLFMVFSIFIGISSESLFSVDFYKKNRSEVDMVLSNQLIVATFMLIVLVITGSVVRHAIHNYFGLSVNQVIACACAAYFGFFIKLFLVDLRFSGKDLHFLIFQSVLIISNVALSILAILLIKDKVFARILALSFSYVSIGLYALSIMLRSLLLKFDIIVIKEIFNFGLPIIPYQFTKWFRNGFDKLLLTNLIGLSANGSYSYLFQIGNIPSYLGSAFNLELTPRLFKIMSGKYHFSDITKYFIPYFILLIFLSGCYAGAIIVANNYFFVNSFVFDLFSFWFILVGSVVHSLTIMIGNVYQFLRRNRLFTIVTVSVSLGGQILNYVFINSYGIRGACMTFFILEGIIFIVSLVYMKKLFYEQLVG